MKKVSIIATLTLILNSCCYCVFQMPELYPIPEDWEFEDVCDGNADEVIPSK